MCAFQRVFQINFSTHVRIPDIYLKAFSSGSRFRKCLLRWIYSLSWCESLKTFLRPSWLGIMWSKIQPQKSEMWLLICSQDDPVMQDFRTEQIRQLLRTLLVVDLHVIDNPCAEELFRCLFHKEAVTMTLINVGTTAKSHQRQIWSHLFPITSTWRCQRSPGI